jgi:hypothetical protein
MIIHSSGPQPSIYLSARTKWRKLPQVWADICSEQHPELAQPPAVSDGIEQLDQEWMQRISQALRPHLDPDSYA